MSNPSISIIVAVYKADSYIRRCLESIRNQTFTDFEVLLVDDGSPDRSGEICDEYAARDPRFRVFHKENGGVSSARQCGIDNARGEYTIHIDPDDWVELNMLEILHSKATETGADMIICGIIKESSEHSQISTNCINIGRKEQITLVSFFSFEKKYGSGLTNKLIKRNKYKDICFPRNLKSCEDTYILIHLLNLSISITSVSDVLYHYDVSTNTNSLTRHGSYDKLFSKERIEFFDALLNDDTLPIKFRNNAITEFAHMAFNYNLLTQCHYSRTFGRYLMNVLNSSVPLRKRFTILLSIFGFKWACNKSYLALKRTYLYISNHGYNICHNSSL